MSRPSVADARALARRHGLDRCVILFTTPAGEIGYASYGATREMCGDTRRMADRLYDEAVAHLTGATHPTDRSESDGE